MTDSKSPRNLIGGPYEPPACRVGSWVTDELFGLVQVNGFSNAPMSWPTRKRERGGPRSLVLSAALAEAIRRESAVAVAHWWGISTKTVRVFRRALDVPRNTEGTLKQHATVAEPPPMTATAKGLARIASDPAIRQRIADKQRGKYVSAETRERLSESLRGVPKPPGWGERANEWMRAGKAKR